MSRQLEAWTLSPYAVLLEIEAVIALLEDEPDEPDEPKPIPEDRDLRCRFPKCNCTFPRRCKT